MIYNVIDLFAGAGGLSLGFKQTGQVKIVAAAENNLNARKTYKRNFKLARLYSDVRTIDYAELQDTVGPVDIVIGGPPCQGFSNANRQHTTVISMNNRLVKEYVRAICELNPKAFVMENVAMLRSQVHRFFLEEQDLDNERIMALPLSEDKIEILPECVNFSNSIAFLETARAEMGYASVFHIVPERPKAQTSPQTLVRSLRIGQETQVSINSFDIFSFCKERFICRHIQAEIRYFSKFGVGEQCVSQFIL